MPMGVVEAEKCISGMVNVCLNLERNGKLNRKELEKYTTSYKRLIYGEKGRKTRYWFIVIHGNHYADSHVTMVFGEQCIPKVYEIKDKKIWWFQGLNSGRHEDDLFETYEEAQDYLIEMLNFEKEETQKKIDTLIKDKGNYNRKSFEDVKSVSKCGCES